MIGSAIRGNKSISVLKNFGPSFGANSHESLIFVDNHDIQRETGLPIATFKEPRIHKAATAFNLAFDFGVPRLMSSFAFDNRDQGPPADVNFNIRSPTFDVNGQCNNGWICEHRWPVIRNMVAFRNAVKGTKVQNWVNNDSKLAFSRGSRGFIIIKSKDDGEGFNERLQTGLPAGVYCDVVTGEKIGSRCTGKEVTVDSHGLARLKLAKGSQEMFIAIYVNAKIKNLSGTKSGK